MAKKPNYGWRPVQLPKDLVDTVESLLKTSRVKKQGITSISQFIARTVNEEILKLESFRMAKVSTYKDHVRIMDNKIGNVGRIVSVYFKKGNSSWCDYCDKANCIHVQYAWEIPAAKEMFEIHGMNYPHSKE